MTTILGIPYAVDLSSDDVHTVALLEGPTPRCPACGDPITESRVLELEARRDGSVWVICTACGEAVEEMA